VKIRGAKQVHYDSGPNMTPLVDIVMVILIFLMLAGRFGGAEHYLVSDLPIQQTGAGGAPPPEGVIPDEPIEVRVDSPVPDRFVARFGSMQAEDAATLQAAFDQLYKQMESAKAGSTAKTQIVISPGRHVKYVFLIQVYEAALRASFKKVAFATSH
jgi:biopolymer transport protein ExbD